MINQGFSNPLFDFILPIVRNKLTWIPLYVFFIWSLINKYGFKSMYIVVVAVLCVVTCDQISSKLVKNTVKRDRPCKVYDQSNDINLLVPCGNGYSFTSSHATNHFGIAILFTILYGRKRWGVLLLSWAGMISFAQVYVGVHFPFDIMGGAIMGVSLGILYGMIAKHLIKKYICNLNQTV